MKQKMIVFDIGGSSSRIALFEGQDIVWRDQVVTPSQAGPEAMVTCMLELYAPVASQTGTIGVAITGHIVNGTVTAHNSAILPGWKQFPLQAELSRRMQRPVRIFNDARAAAWGEYVYGTGQGCDDFLFLTVSTGVGAGLVLQRRLHIASNGFDAEIGEMRLADGNTLEQLASGTALGEFARLHGYTDARDFCAAADQGVAIPADIYQQGISALAAKLADLAVMLGVQRVAVGGSVGLRPGYLQHLRNEIQRYPAIYQLELLPAALRHDAGLIGVADLIRKT